MIKSLIAALEGLQSLKEELSHRLECSERYYKVAMGVDLYSILGANATSSKGFNLHPLLGRPKR